MKYTPIIGLEVHVELKTKSKMFCGCSADHFDKEPNTQTCPVCLGLPGALPVPNRKAVEWCVKVGLALDCEIPLFSKFDRKNYFYPDLPKGYQISQYDQPFCINGKLKLDSGKVIGIRRVHMEEDTGKLQHVVVEGERASLVDFNRSGVPLVEIVTEPDINSSAEAVEYLKKLQQIIRYLDVSDGDMEKGSMRLEPNVSIRKTEDRGRRTELPSYKVEIKNINSFRFVERAIDYEINRQRKILEDGGEVKQETRGFDPQKGITLPQRGKEEAMDYRYFPEPDIPPLRWQQSTINSLRLTIPELPNIKLARLMREYGLSEYDANLLTTTRSTAEYYERSIKYLVSSIKYQKITPKTIANWLINKKPDVEKTSPEQLVELILQKTVPSRMAEEEREKIIKKVLFDNPQAVSDYQAGKTQALMFLIGQVMKATKGQAKAEEVKVRIKNLLKVKKQN